MNPYHLPSLCIVACIFLGFPGGSDGKESAWNVGDLGSIPELGRSPGGGHGNPTPVFLLGESPWMEEPGGLQSMNSQSWMRLGNYAQHSMCLLITYS